MKHPRYELRSITGYETAHAVPGEGKLSTTYWVADTWDCYREVSLQRIASGGRATAPYYELAGKTTKHRRMAERNLRRLNRAHDEWLAA